MAARVIEPVAAGRTNRNFIVQRSGPALFRPRRRGDSAARHFARGGAALRHAGGGGGHRARHRVRRRRHHDHRLCRGRDALDRQRADAGAPGPDRRPAATGCTPFRSQDDLPDFCPVAASHRYLAQLSDAELPIARQRIEACLARLPSLPPHCLIHGDLIPENFILSGDRLLLVDWEYAGNGAVATDLAMVISNFELDAATAQSLLRLYGPVDHTAVETMRVAAIVREALWCLMQARIGGMVGDLPDYTALCLQRLERVLP